MKLKVPMYDTHSEQFAMMSVRSKEIVTMIKIISRSF